MNRILWIAGLGLRVTAGIAVAGIPLDTTFTYQGLLRLAGDNVNDMADIQFSLWDAEAGGSQIGVAQTLLNVDMVDGLFNAEIDFGADAFDGDQRFLRIAVRVPAGGGPYSTLNPRQPLNPAPYASQTRGMFVDSSDTSTLWAVCSWTPPSSSSASTARPRSARRSTSACSRR